MRGDRAVIRRRRSVAGAVAAVVLAAVAYAAWPSASIPAPTRAVASHRRRSHHRLPATYASPAGIVSRAIVAENARPGTTAWKITGAPHTGFIEGFASRTAARAGEQVSLYVSTSAARFTVQAYRMGWYQGKGARLVWQSPAVHGRVQPACPVTPVTNMVSCDNWTRSLRVPITKTFVPGDYLLKLVGSGNQQSYVLLSVWSPSSTAAYLLIARSMTEEGWNTFGGYDFYQGEGSCPPGSPTYPPCNRARVVSFDRPYATGNGAADFLSNEYPLVRLMEQHGLDAEYVTDVTVSAHPSVLLHHRAIISLGHDETWTWSELHGVEQAMAAGENVAFMSAAAIVRHARLQSSPLGPNREVVDYRDSAEDPLNGKASPLEVTGNTWASPPTNLLTTTITGELYSGYVEPGEQPVPFVVYDGSSWIFRGTGLHSGSSIPDVIASDIDHLDPSYPMPPDIQVLGHSPVPLSVAYTNQGAWNGHTYSDMTYYTNPKSKAGVFDSGTVNWIGALSVCAKTVCPARPLSQITLNLLHLFGQGPAGRFQPSVPNWRTLQPPGS